MIAAASPAAFANSRIMPSASPMSGPGYSTQPLVGHHGRKVHGEAGENPLVRPCNHRIDQLAALGEFVKRGVQLAQILTSDAIVGHTG